jgi:two-component system, NtrC family, response regulator AtoC
MVSRHARILIVDDEADMADSIRRILVRAGHEPQVETSPSRALELMTSDRPDLVLCDLRMPEMSGLELLEQLRVRQLALPVVLVTAFATVDTAIDAMKRGAADYVSKPFSPEELVLRVEKTLAWSRLREENRYLRECAFGTDDVSIVGQSPGLREVLRLVDKVALTDSRVLVVGESGTGKELIARTLHRRSPRASEAFFAVNCGALSEGVLESELFGHERGAFTGAVAAKKGFFEAADGGTLFLDEISETTPAFQTRLLRVLQEGELYRVGGTRAITSDVRIVASTNRDPRRALQEGRLREDLFYRLAVVQIVLPPLRDRKDDIPLLVHHFIGTCGRQIKNPVRGIADAAMDALVRYAWPGNVRELENVIERAVIMAEPDRPIDLQHLPGELRGGEPLPQGPLAEVRDTEREVLVRVLRDCEWNRTLAAKTLGIGRRTLYDKLARHGISLKPGVID